MRQVNTKHNRQFAIYREISKEIMEKEFAKNRKL